MTPSLKTLQPKKSVIFLLSVILIGESVLLLDFVDSDANYYNTPPSENQTNMKNFHFEKRFWRKTLSGIAICTNMC
jgi:hypothetical protein